MRAQTTKHLTTSTQGCVFFSSVEQKHLKPWCTVMRTNELRAWRIPQLPSFAHFLLTHDCWHEWQFFPSLVITDQPYDSSPHTASALMPCVALAVSFPKGTTTPLTASQSPRLDFFHHPPAFFFFLKKVTKMKIRLFLPRDGGSSSEALMNYKKSKRISLLSGNREISLAVIRGPPGKSWTLSVPKIKSVNWYVLLRFTESMRHMRQG